MPIDNQIISERAAARALSAVTGKQVEACRAIIRRGKKGGIVMGPFRPYNGQYSKYGITPDDVARLKEEQGGLCAICQRHKKLVIDHSHATKAVRGLLCHNCNIGLGGFEDNPDSLAKAVEYLKRNARMAY